MQAQLPKTRYIFPITAFFQGTTITQANHLLNHMIPLNSPLPSASPHVGPCFGLHQSPLQQKEPILEFVDMILFHNPLSIPRNASWATYLPLIPSLFFQQTKYCCRHHVVFYMIKHLECWQSLWFWWRSGPWVIETKQWLKMGLIPTPLDRLLSW